MLVSMWCALLSGARCHVTYLLSSQLVYCSLCWKYHILVLCYSQRTQWLVQQPVLLLVCLQAVTTSSSQQKNRKPYRSSSRASSEVSKFRRSVLVHVFFFFFCNVIFIGSKKELHSCRVLTTITSPAGDSSKQNKKATKTSVSFRNPVAKVSCKPSGF